MRNTGLLAGMALLLPGCASMVSGSQQSLSVQTVSMERPGQRGAAAG